MILTPERIGALARNYPLLKRNWYFLSAAVLSVCNQPDEVPILYKHVLNQFPETEHQTVTSQFRESILKSAALCGLPRTINSLTALKNATPENLRATEALRALAAKSRERTESDGQELFDKVYGKISKRISFQLKSAYPDLEWFALKHEYGPLLSFTDVLGGKDTSMVIVCSLVPQDVNPQLKGHLKGALNQGATVEEVNSACDLAREISEWSGITWRAPIARL